MRLRRLSLWMLGALSIGIALKMRSAFAVEIPLEAIAPVRIGYVDLQKVFDTYPEKAFAEGDLLKAIEKRKKNLTQKQGDINTLRQQIAADQNALDQAKAGRAVVVPQNLVVLTPTPAPPKPVPPPPVVSTSTLTSTGTVTHSSAPAVEPYPTDEPLAGLPGHEVGASPTSAPSNNLPGMQASASPAEGPIAGPSSPLLDLLAGATAPMLLNAEATGALQKRIDDDHHLLDRDLLDFKDFRTLAIADMKVLEKEKTYDVMSKIYAVLQGLARDENLTVVLDKAYVLYGEESVDLTDQLISQLNQPLPQ